MVSQSAQAKSHSLEKPLLANMRLVFGHEKGLFVEPTAALHSSGLEESLRASKNRFTLLSYEYLRGSMRVCPQPHVEYIHVGRLAET